MAGGVSVHAVDEGVPFRFTIADAAQHYHLPFKFTPWGFSLFRGS
jgi:5-hydroxyisourate hydrolase